MSILPVTRRRLEAARQANPELSMAGSNVLQINRRNLMKAGVPLLISTDAGVENPRRPALLSRARPLPADTVDPQWRLGEGHCNALAALEEEGMDRMEILKSATSNIAKAYKLDAKLGTLEAGKIADLVILDANPLESARHYRRIHAVIKDGEVVKRDALPVAPIITTR